jgi:rhamnose transport system ATP-binding protein
VRNLSQTGYFSNVSFDLHQGEILGFFGLIGAGRSEVMRTVFGIDRKTSGTIMLDGKELEAGSPSAAMRHGLAFVPEDRQSQGVILQMSIARNTTLPQIDAISPFGILDRKRENKITETYGSKMEIRSAGWHVDVDTLSGETSKRWYWQNGWQQNLGS